jgi:hypothetical protein
MVVRRVPTLTPCAQVLGNGSVVVQRNELTYYFRGIHKPIYTAMSEVHYESTCCPYRHHGADSDGAAWFLIYNSFQSQ